METLKEIEKRFCTLGPAQRAELLRMARSLAAPAKKEKSVHTPKSRGR